jgi:hypothetical protein
VTLPYASSNPNPVMRHWDGTAWRPIALPTNTALYNVNYGTILSVIPGPGGSVKFSTPSLSPFGIEDPAPVATSSTPASSTWSLALLGAIGCVALLAYRRVRTA